MNTWLSVIVPVYNASAVLPQLMDALCAQMDEGVELIVVDDGSDDGSGEIIIAAQASHALNIRLLVQENRGVSAARNRGMAEARGTYVCFIDADDQIAPNYISYLHTMAETGQFDIFVFEHMRIAKGGRLPADERQAPPERMLPAEWVERFMVNPTRYGVYNFLLHGEFLRRSAVTFPLGMPYYEDYDFMLRLMGRADRILVSDQCLYGYVQQPGSAMTRFDEQRIKCLVLAEEWGAALDECMSREARRVARFLPARLYWSVLWQAAAALKDLSAARRFAEETGARAQMRRLWKYPNAKVRLSARFYLLSPRLFLTLARALGRKKSQVSATDTSSVGL